VCQPRPAATKATDLALQTTLLPLAIFSTGMIATVVLCRGALLPER
jgi:hypothetical protein